MSGLTLVEALVILGPIVVLMVVLLLPHVGRLQRRRSDKLDLSELREKAREVRRRRRG